VCASLSEESAGHACSLELPASITALLVRVLRLTLNLLLLVVSFASSLLLLLLPPGADLVCSCRQQRLPWAVPPAGPAGTQRTRRGGQVRMDCHQGRSKAGWLAGL
jgi:hypothetical protein